MLFFAAMPCFKLLQFYSGEFLQGERQFHKLPCNYVLVCHLMEEKMAEAKLKATY